jgi:hypothetical protein
VKIKKAAAAAEKKLCRTRKKMLKTTEGENYVDGRGKNENFLCKTFIFILNFLFTLRLSLFKPFLNCHLHFFLLVYFYPDLETSFLLSS